MNSLQALWQQLLTDVKKSWKKTAALGLLAVVGLVMWAPLVMDAVFGESTDAPVAPPAPASTTASSDASTETSPQPSEASSGPKPATAQDTIHWENVDDLLAGHPRLQPARPADIVADPFRVEHDQFSPPVVFADEPVVEDAPDVGPDLAQNLILKSTIIGRTRRAAVIEHRGKNQRKLYFEGSDLRFAGEVFRLERVSTRRVLLARLDGDQVFELRIPRQEN